MAMKYNIESKTSNRYLSNYHWPVKIGFIDSKTQLVSLPFPVNTKSTDCNAPQQCTTYSQCSKLRVHPAP